MNIPGLQRLSCSILCVSAIAALAAAPMYAQIQAHPIPQIVQKDGRYALFVDGAPYLMLGAQVNNSSAWPAMLPKVWPAVEYLHANTVEIPIYWEQFEPSPESFDYTVVDTILAQARQHRFHLVLLWFGTWKNGSSHYMPLWMRTSPESSPHVIGANGRAVDSPSPFSAVTLKGDIRAFTALMEHLKRADPQRTVLMVQVENEPGTWGSIRDYSPEAEKIFDAPVPAELLDALHKQVDGSSNWKAVFGSDADEFFHAWSIARYIQQVAAAGKAVYPLPLYVNAALRDPLKPGPPSTYESGGATDNVIPIWKAAAPAIDILAPDIYLEGAERYLKILDLYRRPDNALFVPETARGRAIAPFFFAALGRQAIGFSPFGMDYTTTETQEGKNPEEALAPFELNYQLVAPMDREIARLNFEGKLQTFQEQAGQPMQMIQFGNWVATASYGMPHFGRNKPPAGNPEPIGRALVAQLGESEFLVAGFYCRIDFHLTDTSSAKQRQYLRVEEGNYENGNFKPIRIWNGDQTDWGLNFGGVPQVIRVSLGTY